jgi:hypothetical protein
MPADGTDADAAPAAHTALELLRRHATCGADLSVGAFGSLTRFARQLGCAASGLLPCIDALPDVPAAWGCVAAGEAGDTARAAAAAHASSSGQPLQSTLLAQRCCAWGLRGRLRGCRVLRLELPASTRRGVLRDVAHRALPGVDHTVVTAVNSLRVNDADATVVSGGDVLTLSLPAVAVGLAQYHRVPTYAEFTVVVAFKPTGESTAAVVAAVSGRERCALAELYSLSLGESGLVVLADVAAPRRAVALQLTALLAVEPRDGDDYVPFAECAFVDQFEMHRVDAALRRDGAPAVLASARFAAGHHYGLTAALAAEGWRVAGSSDWLDRGGKLRHSMETRGAAFCMDGAALRVTSCGSAARRAVFSAGQDEVWRTWRYLTQSAEEELHE